MSTTKRLNRLAISPLMLLMACEITVKTQSVSSDSSASISPVVDVAPVKKKINCSNTTGWNVVSGYINHQNFVNDSSRVGIRADGNVRDVNQCEFELTSCEGQSIELGTDADDKIHVRVLGAGNGNIGCAEQGYYQCEFLQRENHMNANSRDIRIHNCAPSSGQGRRLLRDLHFHKSSL
jgi:hypothetical protein